MYGNIYREAELPARTCYSQLRPAHAQVKPRYFFCMRIFLLHPLNHFFKKTMFNHSKLLMLILSVTMLFAGASCKKEPPIVPPQSQDSITTFERELADGQEPAVSPNGEKIAYTNNGCIYVMDTSGANSKQLTSGTTDVLPRWNPDGQSIGFIRSTPNAFNKGVLYSVPVAGGGVMQLVFNHFVADSLIQEGRLWGEIANPIWDWSPDGKYIAFYSVFGDTTFLNIVSLAKGNIVFKRPTYIKWISDGYGDSFAWSSEMDKIAFISCNDHRRGAAYLYDISSQTQEIDSLQEHPRFITKGALSNRFAYAVSIWDTSSIGDLRTYLAVSDLKTPSAKYYSMQGFHGLKWSPDEKYFVYDGSGYVSGALGYEYSILLLYCFETGKECQLTFRGDINLHNFFFEWGKTSKVVYFERYNKIYLVSFTTQ